MSTDGKEIDFASERLTVPEAVKASCLATLDLQSLRGHSPEPPVNSGNEV